MSFKKTLPRIEIRKKDDTSGRYPNLNKTGDSNRRGILKVFFDDTKTIVYESPYSTIISWPSTLPLNGNFVNNFTSSITTLGKTIKSSVGDINDLPIFISNIGPYKEESSYEQIETTSDYFLTGTDISSVGFGLSSKLKSKATIKFKFPINNSTQFQSASASVYYYNYVTKQFEEINSVNVSPANGSTSPQNTYMSMDTKMFGPFGNFTLSGSEYVPYYGVRNVSKIKNSLNDSLQHNHVSSSLLSNVDYNPSSEQKINLSDYISHPFVIEKAIFEIPIEAGAGWLNDKTQLMPNGAYDNIPDAGGPCITFGIFNTTGDSNKDLILSATLIPDGDNIAEIISFTSSSVDYRSMYGFRNFGSPNAIVKSNSGNSFSGTVIIPSTANIRNGVVSYGAPSISNRTWAASSFNESYIAAIDSYGRGSSVEPCGRSIFGKEYTTQQLTSNVESVNKKLYGDAPSDTYYYPELYMFDSNIPSPYVVFPKDNITISVSKHRPILTVDSNFNSLLVTTGSHDVKIKTGYLYVTLFGSLLKEGIENNDCLNQNISSNAIHESIGYDLIYDEYDVFYKNELKNSYITNYVSGSMTSNSNSSRAKWRDSTDILNATERLDFLDRISERKKYVYHLVSFRRYAEANSTTERFYDSLVPQIDDLVTKGRSFTRLYAWTLPGTSKKTIVLNLDSNQYNGTYSNHSSIDWSRSFPFEPKYSAFKRTTVQKFFVRNILSSLYNLSFHGKYYHINDNIVVNVGINSNEHNIGIDMIYPGPEQTGLKTENAMKLIFGIGDWNNCYNASNGTSTKLFGAVNRPLMIENVLSNSYAGVEVRGWKYGLINANPQYSKNIWRRNKYGQFRDMLEQRMDTKFFITSDEDAVQYKTNAKKNNNFVANSIVTVRFVNVSGSIVLPEETYSSNLSFEATSSLPYFDGIVRNREEPLLVSKIQQFQYLT